MIDDANKSSDLVSLSSSSKIIHSEYPERMGAAGEEEVKLIGLWASPYAGRARIELNMKGIAFEFLQEELGKKTELLIKSNPAHTKVPVLIHGGNPVCESLLILQEELGRKSELLLKSNPVHKKVPVLIHGGKPVCESLVILHYIDEAWPASGPPILPAHPYDCAVARFWAAYIDDKIPPQTRAFVRKADDEAEAMQQLLAALKQLEEAFETISKGGSFFGGDTIGYVDITLGSFLGWFKAFQKIAGIKLLDEQKTPRLVQWAESFCSHDATKDVIVGADELVELTKLLRAVRAAADAPPSS